MLIGGETGRGDEVEPDDQIALMAAHLAVNEPGGEPPWRNVVLDGDQYYRVDSSYFGKAAERLAR